MKEKNRKVNEAGLYIIKKWEGLKTKAYLCPAGVWTIGWGHTGHDVKEGDVISKDYAEELLQKDMGKFCYLVEKICKDIPLTDNQFSALVSFTFNLGPKNLEKSTLLRYLKVKNYKAAAGEFGKWVKAGGQTLPGLISRREEERLLFIS